MARTKKPSQKLRNDIANLSTGQGPYYKQFSHYWARLVEVCAAYGYTPTTEGVPEVLGPPVECNATLMEQFTHPSEEGFHVYINDYRMPSFNHEVIGYCTTY